jgi:hypothetical protein
MYQQILNQMRQAVRAGRVVMTNHAVKEMKRDGLEFGDVTHAILTGEIVEQQFDPDRDEYKYIIYGDALNGAEVGLTAKWGYNDDTVVITVYCLRMDDYDE